ncbi:early nodulin-like protein 18, partial [Phragmites australis]|uniref:early nodulin-like protein 18 n=1 Tax=Phragmites australis TaxID=29695 RepID=UPI002D76E03A
SVSTATTTAAVNATVSPGAAPVANATASPSKNAWAANDSAWAANRTFYLGDYLSFKTDTGNTVLHTTNATVYKLCSGGVAGGSSGSKPEEAFLAVMLTTEGANYFFSDAGDGEHCLKVPSVPLSGAPAGWRHVWGKISDSF